ncbi:MAG: tetratricopeptide repeat protein [Phycisphaerales bacterium]
MASKVNVKFVAILAGSLLAVGIGAAVLSVKMIKKGPQQNVQLSEELETKGDYEGAQRAMARAVNKDPNSATYLRRWLTLLMKTKPETQLGYRERLDSYYMIKRRLSEVETASVPAQREYLDEQMADLRRFGGDATRWGAFAGDVDRIMEKVPATDPARDQLRRYRGLAHLSQLSQNFEMTDADRQGIRDDLEAALKADPGDQLAVAGIADWLRIAARNSMQIKDVGRAEQQTAEAKALLDKFVAEHPPAPYALAALAEVELLQVFMKPPPNSTVAQVFTSLQPRAQSIFDALKKEDPNAFDDGLVSRAADFGLRTGITDSPDQASAILDRMLVNRPNNCWYLLAKASTSLGAGRADEAIERLQKVIDLPDLPVCPEGWALMRLRDMAAAQQVQAALSKWDQARSRLAMATDDAGKEKARTEIAGALKLADELNEKTKSRTNIEERTRKLLNGKLAYARNDLVEARRELNDYVQLTQRSDITAMLLLADVMRRQNTIGEARNLYERVLELDRNNYTAMVELADVEFRLNNLPRTQELYESALRLNPNSEFVQTNLDMVKKVRGGEDSTDPIFKAISQAQKKVNDTNPDMPGATKILLDAEASVTEARQVALLATALARIAEREPAAKMVDRGLVKFPGNEILVKLQKSLASTDPLADGIAEIDAATNLTPENKAVQKYLLAKGYGRNDLAEKFLEELTKLSPENPLVIGAQFDRAIAKKDFVEAARIADLAKKNNVDRLNGLIFEMQLLGAQGKMKEASAAAQRATEMDSLNPAAWRMLGQMQMQNGQMIPAIGSLERALQISPTDAVAISLYTQALVTTGRAPDALAFCREKSLLGANDAAFINQWLTLEFEMGDKDKAMERRARIFAANPSNTQNAIELARNAVMTRKTEQADAVVSKLKTMNLPPNEQVPLTALEAAVLSLKKDQPGALAAFERLVASVPETARAGRVHAGFARLLMDLNNFTLAEQVLVKGQAVEPKDELPASRELADMYFRLSMYDKALPIYQTIYDTIPDTTGNLGLRLAETMLRGSKPADADTLLAKIAADRTAKGQKLDQALLILMARAALDAKDTAKATKLLDEAVAADAGNPMAYFQRAQFRANDPAALDLQIEDLEHVLKIEPKYPGARVPLSYAYLRKRNFDRGVGVLREGLTLEPKSIDLRVTLVRVLVANNQLGPALVELQEGKKIAPDELSWPNITGEIYMIQQNFNGAASEFKTVWDKNKTVANAKNYIDALVRKTPADLETASKVLAEPAINTDKNGMLLVCRAMVRRLDKRPEDMKNDLRQMLTVIKGNDLNECNSVLVLCAQMLFQNVEDALVVFKEIAPPGGHTEAMRLQLGARGSQSADPKVSAAAVEDLTKLCSSSTVPIAANANHLVGSARYGAKQYPEAERYWRRCLELQPDNSEALNNLAYLLAKHLNRASEALPMAERAVQIVPDRTGYIDTLGQTYLALDQLDKADQILTAGVAAASNPVERAAPLIHLTEVKLKKKDRLAADALYRELQNLIQSGTSIGNEIKKRYPDELDQLKRLLDSPT